MSTVGASVSNDRPQSGRLDGYDVAAVRARFPILRRKIHGKSLVYLDNAASTQRPDRVLDAVDRCYRDYYSNVHRGVHTLSQESTEAYEGARETVQRFLGANDRSEVIFTRGTTEALNLVAQAWGRSNLGAGDEVIVTELEHHSNIVPWQLVCEATGARVVPAPIDDRGDLLLDQLETLINGRTRAIAIAHVSNAIGTVNPIAEVAKLAHDHGAILVVDGAQSAPHFAVDLQALDCDFYAFSGHKMYAPSGIGALWGRRELLESMPPWQGGGGMIEQVSFGGTTFLPPPGRFEAGTPNIAGAVGLAAAVDFMDELGRDRLAAHEERLLQRAVDGLDALDGVRVVGHPRRRAGVVSFVLDHAHAHDVGTVLDHQGVAVRAGHHCAQPLMERLGVAATARASFAAFNDDSDVERLLEAVATVAEMFG